MCGCVVRVDLGGAEERSLGSRLAWVFLTCSSCVVSFESKQLPGLKKTKMVYNNYSMSPSRI